MNTYANPNAVLDRVGTNSPGVPAVPLNLIASAGDGVVILSWLPASGALSYNIYRSTSSIGLTQASQISNVTTAYWKDTTVTNGQQYFYAVAAVNGDLLSWPSGSVSIIPKAGLQL